MTNFRKIIKARLSSYGMHCVMGDHPPYYTIQIQLADTETGRPITWDMTPDEAESRAEGLIEYARKVREHNERLEKGRLETAERDRKLREARQHTHDEDGAACAACA